MDHCQGMKPLQSRKASANMMRVKAREGKKEKLNSLYFPLPILPNLENELDELESPAKENRRGEHT